MTRSRFITFALLIALSGAGLTVLMAARAAGDKTTTEPDRPAVAGKRLVCLGYVDARDKVIGILPANFPQPSTVTKVLVREGSEVKEGDSLLEFDISGLNLKVQEAENAIATAKADQARAAAMVRAHGTEVNHYEKLFQSKAKALLTKKSELDEAERLYNIKAINQLEIEAARSAYAEADLNLEAARIKWEGLKKEPPTYLEALAAEAVKKAENAKAQAVHARDQVRCKAPADGRIMRTFVTEGTMYGIQTKEPAFWFLKKSPLIVRAEVTQEFARRVSKGQTAKIEDEADASQVWTGKVIEVPNHFLPKRLGNTGLIDIMPVTDERVLECQISIDPGDTGKNPPRFGQKVRVTLGD
jgi:multidrug efflux pump subunit AcrA (membrane-fusion protein)